MILQSLSFHARYRCQHSGACCSSQWPIPVEADRLAALRAAISTGRLDVEAGDEPFVAPDDAPTETPALLGVHGQRCVFLDTERHRCRVHEILGHDALPLACRQFPRVVVRDPRGVSVVLSHYCPTAERLLGEDADRHVGIVRSPDAFPLSAEYVGLDVRESLPPLLRPGVLMDWESWWELERRAVDLLANAPGPAEPALHLLAGVVECVRTWNPGDAPLIERVERAFDAAREARGSGRLRGFGRRTPDAATATTAAAARRREILDAVPGEFAAPLPTNVVAAPAVLRRFLAAHAFASWTAHLGGGLRTWFRSVEAAFALVTSGFDVRQADLLLRHLTDPGALARRWSAAEADGGSG